MYRKFKFYFRSVLLACLLGLLNPASSPGYLSRSEVFEQSFDMVWSTVHESHWDATFGGLDWEEVRGEYRPKLKRIKTRADLVELIQQMLNELDLSHFKILSSSVKSIDNYPRGGYVGLDLKYFNGRAYVTRVALDSPAASAGIGVGYRLKAIHGKSVKRLIRPFQGQDIPQKRIDFLIQRYLNEVVQGGANRKIRTDWYPPQGKAAKIYLVPDRDTRELSDPVGYLPSQRIEYNDTYLEGNLLYLRFNYFLPNLMADIRSAIESAAGKARGIIIDLRSNGGGLSIMATGITGLLVDHQTNLGTLLLKNGHITYQGYPQAKRFSGPVAILVDGSSVSTSEMLAAGLQESGRARIFGEPSLGESLPSLFKKLPSGDVLQYAVGDFQTPEGFRIEKNGVIPDELILPDSDALRNGLDLPLQKAAEWLIEQANQEHDSA